MQTSQPLVISDYSVTGILLHTTELYWDSPIRMKQLSTVETLLYQFLSLWCLTKSTILPSISLAVMIVC